MRNIDLFLLLPLFVLISCNNTKEEIKSTAVVKEQEAPTAKAITVQQASQVLEGSWISKNYLDNLKKYKAVYNNPSYKTTLFGMSFMGDSLVKGTGLLYGFTQHEAGYTWPLYWDEDTNRFEYDPNQDTGDKPLDDFILNILNNKELELEFTTSGKKELYQKADLETELNRLLAGEYTDKATGKTVTFTLDGKVQGIPGYVQYYVQFDRYEEFALPFDSITLYAKTTDEAGKPFHYKINGNTLTLYTVVEKELEKYVEYTYTIGKEAYVLTRK